MGSFEGFGRCWGVSDDGLSFGLLLFLEILLDQLLCILFLQTFLRFLLGSYLKLLDLVQSYLLIGRSYFFWRYGGGLLGPWTIGHYLLQRNIFIVLLGHIQEFRRNLVLAFILNLHFWLLAFELVGCQFFQLLDCQVLVPQQRITNVHQCCHCRSFSLARVWNLSAVLPV